MTTIIFPESVIDAAQLGYDAGNSMRQALQTAFEEMLKCGMAEYQAGTNWDTNGGRNPTPDFNVPSRIIIRLDHQDKPK